MTAQIIYRSATAADQPAIRELVRMTRINPLGIKWPAFLVAEANGMVVGIGQVKRHRDGSRELASIAVHPAHRRQGIASEIIRQLLEDEDDILYLTCLTPMEGFYLPFGFKRMTGDELSGYMGRLETLNRWAGRFAGLFGLQPTLGIVMGRDGKALSPPK